MKSIPFRKLKQPFHSATSALADCRFNPSCFSSFAPDDANIEKSFLEQPLNDGPLQWVQILFHHIVIHIRSSFFFFLFFFNQKQWDEAANQTGPYRQGLPRWGQSAAAPSPPGSWASHRAPWLCSWQWGRWRGWPSARWRPWATAGQRADRRRPGRRWGGGPGGTPSPSPADAPFYWQSVWGVQGEMEKQILKKCSLNVLNWRLAQWVTNKLSDKSTLVVDCSIVILLVILAILFLPTLHKVWKKLIVFTKNLPPKNDVM